MKKTLIILAHPNMNESKLNKALIHAVANEPHVSVHDLYAVYQTAENIDIEKEQALLVANDRIIFQFPLYWLSSPGLLKDWQDKVLTYGFAYGSEGSKLAGKEFKIAVTTGSPEFAFQAGAYNNASIGEYLKPFQGMANFTQMTYTKPFSMHGALKMTEDVLVQKTAEYKELLAEQDWSTSLFKYLQGK